MTAPSVTSVETPQSVQDKPKVSHATSCHDLYELPQPRNVHPAVRHVTSSCHDIYDEADGR